MKNERKQTNRNAEENRSSRKSDAANNAPNTKPKRPLDWDARDLKESTWIPGGSGRYEDRFFE